jgi:hypothetical protein
MRASCVCMCMCMYVSGCGCVSVCAWAGLSRQAVAVVSASSLWYSCCKREDDNIKRPCFSPRPPTNLCRRMRESTNEPTRHSVISQAISHPSPGNPATHYRSPKAISTLLHFFSFFNFFRPPNLRTVPQTNIQFRPIFVRFNRTSWTHFLDYPFSHKSCVSPYHSTTVLRDATRHRTTPLLECVFHAAAKTSPIRSSLTPLPSWSGYTSVYSPLPSPLNLVSWHLASSTPGKESIANINLDPSASPQRRGSTPSTAP